ncbi:MAG: hypothetical protein NT031_01060, partial [Planctomycetota bacterium]|nr:hypothetical protein [Planctomycetota bacterium]
MGAKVRLDTIVVTNFDAPFDLAALGPASVSADLKTWTPVTMSAREKVLTVSVPGARPVRYLRISGSFGKIADIAGRCGGKRL